eukprot:5721865-Lingulodinium_polyedra.AAC.1
MAPEPPGLEVKNRYAVFREEEEEDEIPMLSMSEFPALSRDTEIPTVTPVKIGSIEKKTQRERKKAQRTAAGEQ